MLNLEEYFPFPLDPFQIEAIKAINSGNSVVLTAPTGSGKTTLLKMLYFDLFPHKGKVEILKYSSSNIKKSSIHKVRKKVGVVFQDYKLLKQRSVY